MALRAWAFKGSPVNALAGRELAAFLGLTPREHSSGHNRPHEAHDQRPPASAYEPSTRPFPKKLKTPEYPAHFEVRKVSTNGGVRWYSTWVNVSHLLGREYIGLEEIADGIWVIYFGSVSLGWLHIDKGAILDHDGSSSRNPKL